MAPVVDLTDLQNVVSRYADQHQLVIAAGPLTAAALVRTLVTKHKLASTAVAVGGAWFAVQELAGPCLRLIGGQFGYLQSLLGN